MLYNIVTATSVILATARNCWIGTTPRMIVQIDFGQEETCRRRIILHCLLLLIIGLMERVGSHPHVGSRGIVASMGIKFGQCGCQSAVNHWMAGCCGKKGLKKVPVRIGFADREKGYCGRCHHGLHQFHIDIKVVPAVAIQGGEATDIGTVTAELLLLKVGEKSRGDVFDEGFTGGVVEKGNDDRRRGSR